MITPADLVVVDETGYRSNSTQTFSGSGKPSDSDSDRS
jgi:hypothetical protein